MLFLDFLWSNTPLRAEGEAGGDALLITDADRIDKHFLMNKD